jgi:hypothetical protein
LTSCPNDCEWPPGPFGAIDMSRLNGAVGSSFWPEKTQIEFACVGPAVGFPLPVISPASAALTLKPATAAVHAATASRDLIPIIVSLPICLRAWLAPATKLNGRGAAVNDRGRRGARGPQGTG